MKRSIVFFLLAACGSDAPAPADLAPAADLTPAPDLAPAHSGIGDACDSSGFEQGTCNDGQICVPPSILPGGYCTQACPCPSDSTCVSVPGQGKFCFVNCQAEADCRTPDYTCDPQQHVCFPTSNPEGDGVTPGTRDGGACVTPIVSPPDGGLFGANLLVSEPAGFGAETQLAVDPTNQHVVIAYIDIATTSSTGVVSSGDDGVTFGAPYTLPADMTVDANRAQSDPVVAVDADGRFYVSWVGYDPTASPNPNNMNMYVARSTNGGVTIDQLVMASPAGEWVTNTLLDKPWIAASPAADKTVYLTWARITQTTSDIRMTRSTDNGATWSVPITVNDSSVGAERNLAQVTVGSDGLAVVVWMELAGNQFGDTANRIVLQRFQLDGTPNGANVVVSGAGDSPPFEDPSVASAPPNVYVGFISGTSRGDWDVRVAASLDGGGTFGPAVKVNDDPTCATHFHHQIGVAANGDVHAIWYDNRYLVGNVFHASSPAAAAGAPLAFGANGFVNHASFPFTTSRVTMGWLGDYLGLWLAGGEIYASWSDPRAMGTSRIFFAKGTLP
jgi:hypothetical protein